MGAAFSGRVALVAGGTGGLGRAVSLAFLGEGANVVVTYRRRDELAALTAAAGTSDGRLDGHEADVTDEGAVKRLVESVLARHGRLDAFVNAVGGYSGGKPLWDQDPSVLARMLELNLRSGYTLLRAVVPRMLAQGHGAIVNVAGRAALDHAAGIGEYSASKAAALAMVDSLAADLKGTGVRVNSILPSIIDTEINRKAMPGADFTKWPKPEEIARVILFLCGDDAKLVRGAAIPVYGDS
jgi:NAD(P)-dependent dehydrogenase (short-subunit alcohol dehydrogenase family)